MPTPRTLDVVYRDRRPSIPLDERPGDWARFSAFCLTGLWAAYLGAVAPVVWMGFASLRTIADGATPADPGVFGAVAVIASGFVLFMHLVATGLGVCVALVSLVIVHASGVAVRRLPFGIALAAAMLSVTLLKPSTNVAITLVQIFALLGTGAYGVVGTWRVWRASLSGAEYATS